MSSQRSIHTFLFHPAPRSLDGSPLFALVLLYITRVRDKHFETQTRHRSFAKLGSCMQIPLSTPFILSTPCRRFFFFACSQPVSARPTLAAAGKDTVKLTFIEEGRPIEVDAPIGKSVLDVSLDNDIDIEGERRVWGVPCVMLLGPREPALPLLTQHPLTSSLVSVDVSSFITGACGGELACSTCHVVVKDKAYFDKLPKKTEEEEDMLDLAWGVTETYVCDVSSR